jgi:hypothetical protein
MTFPSVAWRRGQLCLGYVVRMLCELSLHVVFIVQSDLSSFTDILEGVVILSENERNESYYNR